MYTVGTILTDVRFTFRGIVMITILYTNQIFYTINMHIAIRQISFVELKYWREHVAPASSRF